MTLYKIKPSKIGSISFPCFVGGYSHFIKMCDRIEISKTGKALET